jgi:hypothetical protein
MNKEITAKESLIFAEVKFVMNEEYEERCDNGVIYTEIADVLDDIDNELSKVSAVNGEKPTLVGRQERRVLLNIAALAIEGVKMFDEERRKSERDEKGVPFWDGWQTDRDDVGLS